MRFAELGIGAGLHPFTDGKRAKVLAAAIAPAVAKIKSQFLSDTVNGWSVNRNVRPIVHDPLLRAAFNQYGPGTHIAEEALYFSQRKGDDGQVLSGANRYALRFPAGGLPPVDAFWSLTLYGHDFLLVENSIKRYAINARTAGLVYGADGSLEIVIQHEAPNDPKVNWLPAPKGPFQLVLRAYQPKPSVLDGSYKLPPLIRL